MKPSVTCVYALVAVQITSTALAQHEPSTEVPTPNVEATSEQETGELVAPLPHPRHRLYFNNLIAARLNPLGLVDSPAVGYRLRLYDSQALLLKDSFVGVELTPHFSPSYMRLGGTVIVKPLAVLQLSASLYDWVWFPTFGNLQSSASPTVDWSDSGRSVGGKAGLSYGTTGTELELRGLLQVKVGPVAVRTDTRLSYAAMKLATGDRYFYNAVFDILAPNQGWALSNDTDVLYMSDFGLIAGLRATVVHCFYQEDAASAEELLERTPTLRAGPLVAYTFSDNLFGLFNKPTVLAIVNAWLRHPYRTGADVSVLVPYVVIGFRFEGDLWQAGQ